MNKYRFLVLTDHTKHSKENSVYAIVSTLAKHTQCSEVVVVSRGNSHNASFFQNCKLINLWGHRVHPENGLNFEQGKEVLSAQQEQVALADFDVLLMRLPRPISDTFLRFIASKMEGKVIINHPTGIIETSSKAYLLHFPELCPPIQLCHSIAEILDWANRFSVVLKPLREYGGKGIFKIAAGKIWEGNNSFEVAPYLEQLQNKIETEGYLVMKYLKNVSQGDKRIIVVNGHILAASLRLPAADSWLCNVSQGGRSVLAEISPEEQQIIDTITPNLLQAGIVIYGADTLVDDDGKRVLSEINTLSIGGFPQAEQQTGRPILQQTIDQIITYVEQQTGK